MMNEIKIANKIQAGDFLIFFLVFVLNHGSRKQSKVLLNTKNSMKMKKCLMLIGIMIFTTALIAQPPQRENKTPEEVAKDQTEKMIKDLSLTKEQVPVVLKINIYYAEEMAQLRRKANGDRETMREAMMNLGNRKSKEMKAVLTKKQYRKYESMQEQHMKSGPPGGRGKRQR